MNGISPTDLSPATSPAVVPMGMVDLDASLFLASGVFLVLLVLLNFLLFQPYLAIVRERQRLTTGAQGEAAEAGARARAIVGEYEAKIEAARTEAAALRESLRSGALADEARILAAARDQAQASLDAQRASLATAMHAAEAQVEQRAASLAQAIVAKVLS